jgi:hypothetical protein
MTFQLIPSPQGHQVSNWPPPPPNSQGVFPHPSPCGHLQHILPSCLHHHSRVVPPLRSCRLPHPMGIYGTYSNHYFAHALCTHSHMKKYGLGQIQGRGGPGSYVKLFEKKSWVNGKQIEESCLRLFPCTSREDVFD